MRSLRDVLNHWNQVLFVVAALCLVALSSNAGTSTNKALRFDGVDDYLEIPAQSSLSLMNHITLEAWVRWFGIKSNTNAVQMIINQDHIQYEMGIGEIANPRRFSWFFGDMSTNAPDAGLGWHDGGPITENEWTHVAVTYNKAQVRTYINGERVNTFSGSGHIAARGNPVRIGARNAPNLPISFFNGEIDEVRIWNRSLDDEEIRQNYFLELTGGESGLVGYWKFDEGSGQTAFDSGTFGNHARLGQNAADSNGDPIWIDANRNSAAPFTAHIEPENPLTLDDLACITESAGGETSFEADFIYRWYRNGAELTDGLEVGDEFFSHTGSVLSNLFTTKGDAFRVRAEAEIDGLLYIYESNAVTIGNTAPTAPEVRILPETPRPKDGLAVWIDEGSEDADGDPIIYLFEWYESSDAENWRLRTELSGRRNPLITGEPEISGLYTQAAEFWRVVVTPFDVQTKSLNKAEQAKAAKAEGPPAAIDVFVAPDLDGNRKVDARDMQVYLELVGQDPATLPQEKLDLVVEQGNLANFAERLKLIFGRLQQNWYRED